MNEIIAEILDVPPDLIDVDSSPQNFVQWDSAAHIDIVLSLEAEYGVSFSAQEMVEVLSVAAIKECLRRKGAEPK